MPAALSVSVRDRRAKKKVLRISGDRPYVFDFAIAVGSYTVASGGSAWTEVAGVESEVWLARFVGFSPAGGLLQIAQRCSSHVEAIGHALPPCDSATTCPV